MKNNTWLITHIQLRSIVLKSVFLTCTAACWTSCVCMQRTPRRRCLSWVLAMTSRSSTSASLPVSSHFPPRLRVSTSEAFWSLSYSEYEMKTPASPLLVRHSLKSHSWEDCRVSTWPFSWRLSGRFRQVQVLTAMANAFYSLYSHVSRTPLQKLAPPELTFYSSPVEKMERFRSSIRSEPRSPVERLKDTVSKMCLYTGSPRGSESTSPQPSPKKRCSLSDVGELDQETVQPRVAKNLNLGESNRINSTADVHLASDTLHSRPKSCYTNNKNAVVDGNSNKAVSVDNKTQGARTSLSLETVDRGDNQCPLCQQELEPTGTPAATAAPEEPLSCCRPKPNTASCICSARRKDASSFPSFMPNVVSEHEQDNPTQPSPARQNHGSISSNLQKVNSFELEEVCYSFKNNVHSMYIVTFTIRWQKNISKQSAT